MAGDDSVQSGHRYVSGAHASPVGRNRAIVRGAGPGGLAPPSRSPRRPAHSRLSRHRGRDGSVRTQPRVLHPDEGVGETSCELSAYEGSGHGFFNYGLGHFSTVAATAEGFLQSQGLSPVEDPSQPHAPAGANQGLTRIPASTGRATLVRPGPAEFCSAFLCCVSAFLCWVLGSGLLLGVGFRRRRRVPRPGLEPRRPPWRGVVAGRAFAWRSLCQGGHILGTLRAGRGVGCLGDGRGSSRRHRVRPCRRLGSPRGSRRSCRQAPFRRPPTDAGTRDARPHWRIPGEACPVGRSSAGPARARRIRSREPAFGLSGSSLDPGLSDDRETQPWERRSRSAERAKGAWRPGGGCCIAASSLRFPRTVSRALSKLGGMHRSSVWIGTGLVGLCCQRWR